MAFFGYFRKGDKNGWNKKPRVMLNVRRPGENFTPRGEDEWPLKRTKWTKFYLDPVHMSLGKKPPEKKGKIAWRGMSSDGITFMMPPMAEDTELCGPIAYRLFISSATEDADQIGRASCRERVCQTVCISVGAVHLKK